MIIVLKMFQNFLQSCPASFVFHNEKETTTDFSGIERNNPYFFILELAILIKKILESEEKPIFLLIRKTHEMYNIGRLCRKITS